MPECVVEAVEGEDIYPPLYYAGKEILLRECNEPYIAYDFTFNKNEYSFVFTALRLDVYFNTFLELELSTGICKPDIPYVEVIVRGDILIISNANLTKYQAIHLKLDDIPFKWKDITESFPWLIKKHPNDQNFEVL